LLELNITTASTILLSRSASAPSRCRAFSLAEVVVTLTIAAILVTVSTVAISRAQRAASLTVCATNLRSIGYAFRSYTMDNAGHYPKPLTSAQWEDLLRVYIHRPIFRCPADHELFNSLGSSYDWRDTADYECSLAGRSITEITRGDVSLAFDALPGWHLPGKLQAIYVDGSVRLVDDEPFLQELQTPVTAGHP
jgi:prepilin-type N-terminal cleavage/methylation domain-containing protein